jgi:hypothetical protein
MDKRLIFPFISSLSFAIISYVSSYYVSTSVAGSIIFMYPELAILVKGLSYLIAGLAFILSYSIFKTKIWQDNSIERHISVIYKIILIIVLIGSLYIFILSISVFRKNSAMNWEQVEVVDHPFVQVDFLKLFRQEGGTDAKNIELIGINRFTIFGVRKSVLQMHPISQISFQINPPYDSKLMFSIALAPDVWHLGKGDGVQFNVYLNDGKKTVVLFSRYLDPKNIFGQRQWHDQEIDLQSWANQTVTITFATDCGPNDDCRYDWAGWGDPRIVQPLAYDFISQVSEAEIVLYSYGSVESSLLTIDQETRPILFQHPSSRVIYPMKLPEKAALQFGLGMSPDVWSPSMGDGVEYSIYIRKPSQPDTLNLVYRRFLDPKNEPMDQSWFDERVDLSQFGGENVEVIFEALPGPAGNADFDWGGWSSPVLIDETLP